MPRRLTRILDVLRLAWLRRAWPDAAPWWGYIVVALAMTHVTIACVTIFLHRRRRTARSTAPDRSHFFRFWLWLTTGMVTKEWVAIHRKHHAQWKRRTTRTARRRAASTPSSGAARSSIAPKPRTRDDREIRPRHADDWMERNVYTRFSWEGVGLMLMVNFMLFGGARRTIWAVQMAWIPVTAAGVINGIGHYWGYRNFASADASKNIVPWGILIGGEELHNNHHAYGTSAKLSSRWYEFDLGWTYIRILDALGLAQVRKVAPSCGGAPARRPGRANAARGDREPLRGRHCLCAHAEGHVRAELARLRGRAGRGDFAKVPSKGRLKRWLSGDTISALREHEARVWPGRWKRAARSRRSTRCARR
jgi:stearoyl-CoA desaturase (delta-9 desaturase)